MKQLLSWLIVILGLIALITFGLSALNESAANKAYAKGQARAMVIEAQAQARLDSAQANAINQAANLPYLILALITVFGSAILVLAVVILRQQQTSIPTRIEREILIETRIIFLPAGQNRRQMWQTLSDNQQKLLANRSKE